MPLCCLALHSLSCIGGVSFSDLPRACLLSAEAGNICTMQMRTVHELAGSLRTTLPASNYAGAPSREGSYTQVVSHTVTED